jgi:dihydropteroate synthase
MEIPAKNKEIKPIAYSANGKTLRFEKPLIMAIINLTPDSFYDGGKYSTVNDVIADVRQKLAQGADILDVGAASTRPGAPRIDSETEWSRMQPILRSLREEFPQAWLSVDTYHSSTAERSLALGADMINDVSGGTFDNQMYPVVSKYQVPYVLMHLHGTPETMKELTMKDPEQEVIRFFEERLTALKALNIRQVILDPGFGFGKSLANNYELLKAIPRFAELGFPVLAGVSRKSLINRVIGTNPVSALNGTTVLHTISLLNGAGILRVHDVAEAIQVAKLVGYYRSIPENANSMTRPVIN